MLAKAPKLHLIHFVGDSPLGVVKYSGRLTGYGIFERDLVIVRLQCYTDSIAGEVLPCQFDAGGCYRHGDFVRAIPVAVPVVEAGRDGAEGH